MVPSQIADFGTSRWTQSTNTTGLATYTTKSNQNTQMSIAWSAPEVRSLRTLLVWGFSSSGLTAVIDTANSVYRVAGHWPRPASFLSNPMLLLRRFLFARPQVLDSHGTTCKSDVYSFGIVVWEVLSRQLPWSNKTRPSQILSAVLMGVRPSFPVDAPADIADIAKACWCAEPKERTTFRAILEGMKAGEWSDE